jgi:hypothetical protein
MASHRTFRRSKTKAKAFSFATNRGRTPNATAEWCEQNRVSAIRECETWFVSRGFDSYLWHGGG